MSSFGVAIALTLLLEAMQDKHRFRKFDGVDGAIGAAGIVFDNFQNTSPSKAFEWLCRVMLAASLREIQGVTKELPHIRRQRHKVFLAAADPDERLIFVGHALVIPVMG